MRSLRYWDIPRLDGEDSAAHAARAGRIYFDVQLRENAQWWQRVGLPVDLRGQRVLDVGCGHGALSLDAATRGAATVTGIDLDASRVQFGRGHLLACYPGHSRTVNLLPVSIADLPPGEAFDVVLSKDTFEHVDGLDLLIPEVARRLRPGGLLVCGFSPLYYSPNGDHGRYRLPLPWLHALLPQSLVFRWASRRLGQSVRSATDVGLNRLTPGQFRALVAPSQWEEVSLRINPIAHPLRPVFDLLRQVPSLERYFTVGIYGVFRKPSPASRAASNSR